MEFHISMSGPIDPGAIEDALRAVDASALVDIDPSGQTLRVAASIDAVQLVAVLNQAGYPANRNQVARAPSICCGGCSG